MFNVHIKESNHHWIKRNLVTITNGRQHYDQVECSQCHMKGKRYSLTHVEVSERYKKDNVFNCKNAPKVMTQKIRIKRCNAGGKQFANLTDGSEHLVISPPDGYENDHRGVWVMGVGEPVKVLSHEFEVIDGNWSTRR